MSGERRGRSARGLSDPNLLAEIERLRAENQQLREREECWRYVLDHMPQKIFLKDLESRFLYVNAMFAADHRRRPEEIVGLKDDDLFPEALARKYRLDDRRVAESRQPITAFEKNHAQGMETTVEVTKCPFFDAHGKAVGVLGWFSDVTQRKRAEDSLTRSRQLLQAILDNSPAVIYVKDVMMRYVLINRRYEEIFGVKRDQVKGKSAHELFPAELADEYRRYDRTVLDSRQPLQVEETLVIDGEQRTAISVKFPIADATGAPYAVCGISTDITERKRAEEALRDSEARKGAILESCLDCIVTMDAQGRITEFNPAAERTFGYRRQEVLGRDLAAVLFPSEDRDGHRGRMDSYMATSEGSMLNRHVESYAVAADGRHFPVEMGMTLRTVGNQPIFTVYLRDITQRKEAEQAMRKQAFLLAQQAKELEERNTKLTKAYDELQDAETQLIHSEKMAAIGQLVAGLAHEINTPVAYVLTNLDNIRRDIEDLAAFINACQQLENELSTTHPELVERLQELRQETGVDESAPEMQQLLDATRTGMMRIRDLVADLRSYSRVDVRGELAMADLNESISTTLRLWKPIAGKNIELEIVLGDLPMVECNAGKINQVLMNLLNNAAQAMNGVGKIRVATERAQDGIQLRVRDSGPGIPKEIQSRIFDPFFTTKGVGQGTGLGLSISRKIVDSHGGHLTFSTKPGAGTEFLLWLPLKQENG